MGKQKRKFNTANENLDCAQDIGKRKRFHVRDLANLHPQTEKQKDFFEVYYTDVPLILLNGVAGTGKTLVAFYSALNDVFSPDFPQDKVVIVRSAVESGQSQGFLPGDIEEKNEPYEAPYRGIAKTLMPGYNEPYRHLKSLGYVEFVTTTYVRGITIDDSVIMIEEVQNMDYHEIRSIISRAGRNTRILITGDTNQDDLKRKKKESGVSTLQKVMLNMPVGMAASVTFGVEDIVRGGLCGAFIKSEYEVGLVE